MNADIRLGRYVPLQRAADDTLPLYNSYEPSEARRYIWTRRRMLVEDTFGSFAMHDWTHLPTTQQTGRIFNVGDRR